MAREVLRVLVLLAPLFGVFSENKHNGFYDYNVKTFDGETVSLKKYIGKVSLVVNVASECGYTDEHYKELTALQNELVQKEQPFTVLAFPCNQFGEQEPHDNHYIQEFASSEYKASFPIFAKIDVRDRDAHPAYEFLRRSTGQEPQWNFWKYLLDGSGNVINEWGPSISVSQVKDEILKAIQKLKNTHAEL
uniref:Glutathione peroxidase n=1 Tax=Ciona intestinalis TaxID=7719 RepID=F6RM35_CIOIN|nr:glutathione peroxidase 7 precursor [Ciona intestinalis]|eukprot:NP_001177280.1 glutathione peroxidase 7 precursor [Ciona intestinalis]